ncbi:hypothetical protein BGM26_12590 [Bacillus sp. FJAT-29790]|uniref:hypothetical protein n=1 Tax=Bacillus sp. FJAT-29790 TaxID=1895002 RepID=UPI001C222783|nr:hypothetical protein [Bacillus sp. FJAT-29790]MBU8879827.1 hypothetical protein [Bacillus sp. FJAT-29790]
MKKIILSLIGATFLILSMPGFSLAAPILKMEELKIQIMPEYANHPNDKVKDHPSLLVGYHGSLINNTDKPKKGQIEIPLPMNDDEFRIGFVADYNRDFTQMNEIEYKIDEKNSMITWETSEDIQPQEAYKFVIEYYTGQIKAGGETKTLSFQFKSFADIRLVSVVFLEPLKTENFKLNPQADSHQENPYGMNMFLYQIQGMKPNEVKEFQLQYQRAESKTTMEIMEEMAGNPTHGEGAVKKNETIPIWVIISTVGGFSVISALLIVFFLNKKKMMIHRTEPEKPSAFKAKKSRLRAMLLEGSISEQEYSELLKKLGGK